MHVAEEGRHIKISVAQCALGARVDQCQVMQEAKLIDARVVGKMYYVEYTVLKPKQDKRHLLSLVALGNNGT